MSVNIYNNNNNNSNNTIYHHLNSKEMKSNSNINNNNNNNRKFTRTFDLSQIAEDPMDCYLDTLNLWKKRIARDGSCLFRAVAEQVNSY
jgi:hypothetical protein